MRSDYLPGPNLAFRGLRPSLCRLERNEMDVEVG
jgi:hypothetical protein